MATHASKCVRLYVLILYFYTQGSQTVNSINSSIAFYIELIFFLTSKQYELFQKKNLNKYETPLCHMTSGARRCCRVLGRWCWMDMLSLE